MIKEAKASELHLLGLAVTSFLLEWVDQGGMIINKIVFTHTLREREGEGDTALILITPFPNPRKKVRKVKSGSDAAIVAIAAGYTRYKHA